MGRVAADVEEAVADDDPVVAVLLVLAAGDVDAEAEVSETVSDCSWSCSLSEPAGTRVASVSPPTQCLATSSAMVLEISMKSNTHNSSPCE